MSGLKDNPNFETNTLKIWRSHKKNIILTCQNKWLVDVVSLKLYLRNLVCSLGYLPVLNFWVAPLPKVTVYLWKIECFMEFPDPKGCNKPDIIQAIVGKGDKPNY